MLATGKTPYKIPIFSPFFLATLAGSVIAFVFKEVRGVLSSASFKASHCSSLKIGFLRTYVGG